MYPLFETIKTVEGIPQYLSFHQERMIQSYLKFYGTECPFVLSKIFHIPQEYKKGIVKARFLYGKEGYVFEFENYSPKKIHSLQLTICNEIDYSLKYTNRELFTKLLLQKRHGDDILIVKNGYITDTSFANIALYDGQAWYTPSTFLLAGTCRKRLLQQNLLKEIPVRVEDLYQFEYCKLVNAMLDFENQPFLPVANIRF